MSGYGRLAATVPLVYTYIHCWYESTYRFELRPLRRDARFLARAIRVSTVLCLYRNQGRAPTRPRKIVSLLASLEIKLALLSAFSTLLFLSFFFFHRYYVRNEKSSKQFMENLRNSRGLCFESVVSRLRFRFSFLFSFVFLFVNLSMIIWERKSSSFVFNKIALFELSLENLSFVTHCLLLKRHSTCVRVLAKSEPLFKTSVVRAAVLIKRSLVSTEINKSLVICLVVIGSVQKHIPLRSRTCRIFQNDSESGNIIVWKSMNN